MITGPLSDEDPAHVCVFPDPATPPHTPWRPGCCLPCVLSGQYVTPATRARFLYRDGPLMALDVGSANGVEVVVVDARHCRCGLEDDGAVPGTGLVGVAA